MHWILVADASTAKIFSGKLRKKNTALKLLSEYQHAASKKKGRELIADRPGHYKTQQPTYGAYSPHTEPKEIEVRRFAKEIARVLNHGRITHEYDGLILCAPAHFHGLLAESLDKDTLQLVTHTIHKDYIHLPANNLIPTLIDMLQTLSA